MLKIGIFDDQKEQLDYILQILSNALPYPTSELLNI